MSFAHNSVNAKIDEESKKSHQLCLVESNPSIVKSNGLNCADQTALNPDKNPDSSDKSIELNNCPRLPPASKLDLGTANPLTGQPFGLAHLPNFYINASNPSAGPFLKIDRSLIQSTPSVGLLIMNRADANKLVQQTHSLSLASKPNPTKAPSQPSDLFSRPNGSNGSSFPNDLNASLSYTGNNSVCQRLSGFSPIRTHSTINRLPPASAFLSTSNQLLIASHQFHLAGSSVNHTENGTNYLHCNPNNQMSVNQNANQQLNVQNDGQSMSFLEHCPSGGPFSIQPVRCY